MGRRIGHRVRPKLLQPLARFLACQALRNLTVCSRCRFGRLSSYIKGWSSGDHYLACIRSQALRGPSTVTEFLDRLCGASRLVISPVPQSVGCLLENILALTNLSC